MLYTLGKVFVFMTQMPAVNVVQPALHLEPMRGACPGRAWRLARACHPKLSVLGSSASTQCHPTHQRWNVALPISVAL